MMKASEPYAADANSAVESFMARGHSPVPELDRQAMRRLPHGKWRDCEADETVRFFALRMCEAGMVNSTLQKLLTSGTGRRIFSDLKKD